jgi:hypothetical protein
MRGKPIPDLPPGDGPVEPDGSERSPVTTKPIPLILTVKSGYDRRQHPLLLNLQLALPSTILTSPNVHYWVVNYRFDEPKEARQVTITGRPVTFRRRPEIRLPWRYGAPHTPQVAYGHFISLDGETWDTSNYNYAPYTILSEFNPNPSKPRS